MVVRFFIFQFDKSLKLRYKGGAKPHNSYGGTMGTLRQWWHNDLPVGVKIVFMLLLANALPAIIILMTLPARTEQLFVWTVKPVINARLLGVMYGNALILIAIGIFQPNWARVRIIMVLITLFSILATVLTFVYLKPFLAHPWYHLAYWLGMYLALCFAAPYVLVTEERKHGGRLPIEVPLGGFVRLVAIAFMLVSLLCSLGLFFAVESVNQAWPWKLPPLVGGLIGVLFFTHAAAYAWALWDGDWLRIRPIFWQALPTALLFLLLPWLHTGDLRSDAGTVLAVYTVLAALGIAASLGVILSYRGAEGKIASHA
jgi:hypothetical protein